VAALGNKTELSSKSEQIYRVRDFIVCFIVKIRIDIIKITSGVVTMIEIVRDRRTNGVPTGKIPIQEIKTTGMMLRKMMPEIIMQKIKITGVTIEKMTRNILIQGIEIIGPTTEIMTRRTSMQEIKMTGVVIERTIRETSIQEMGTIGEINGKKIIGEIMMIRGIFIQKTIFEKIKIGMLQF
jgi:hypothetical protein